MLLAILILGFANLALGAARGWRLEERINALETQLQNLSAIEAQLVKLSAGDWQRVPHDRANFLSELGKLTPEQLAAYREALAFHAGGMPAEH